MSEINTEATPAPLPAVVAMLKTDPAARTPAAEGSCGMSCRHCGIVLGKRFYAAECKVSCRACALKLDPEHVALEDANYERRGIFDDTAAERWAKAMQKPAPAPNPAAAAIAAMLRP